MEPRSEEHPKKIATVLVPTDFSDESHKALRYGAALARKLQANLHVVHVSETDFALPGPALPGTNSLTSDTEEARSLKQQLEAAIGQSLPVTFHGRTGRAFDQIVRLAREMDAGLIVMSTHGRTGLRRMILGSNAERVVQHSSSPVLVVRRGGAQLAEEGRPLRIEKILVPTDFSASSRETLNYAREFGGSFGAQLVLFHVFYVPELTTTDRFGIHNLPPTLETARLAAEEQMRDFVAGVDFGGLGFATEITMGRAAEEICRYAEQEKIDLIITSTHGRTGFMHVLIGSVAEHVVRYAHSPVLVVPGSIKQAIGAQPARSAD